MENKNNGILSENKDELVDSLNKKIKKLEEANSRLRNEIDARKLAQFGLKQGENFLQSVLISLEDMFVCVLDKTGMVNFIWGPEKLERKYNLVFSDYMGKLPNEYIREYPEEEKLNLIHRVFDTGKTIRDIRKITTPKENYWLDFSISPMVDEENKIDAAVACVKDVTEYIKVERRLKESEQRFRSLVEFSPVPLSIVKTNGEIEYVNPGLIQTFGYTLNDVPNMNELFTAAISDTEYRRKVIKAWNTSMERIKTEPIKPSTVRVTRKDGLVRTVVFKMVYMGNNKICISNEDITEIKEAEKKLQDSEEKYRVLIKQLPETIYELDINGDLRFVNQAALKTFGYSQEDFEKGVNSLQIIAPEDREKARKNFFKVLKGQKLGPLEYVAQKKDGVKFPIIINSIPLYHDEKFERVIGIVIDISERKKSEKKIKESEEKYRSLVETSGDIIFETDLEGKFLFINSAVTEISGYSVEEIMKLNGLRLIHPDDYKSTLKRSILAGKGQRINNIEYRSRKKDGTYNYFSTNISPVFDSQNNIIAIQGIARDITERKIAEKEIKESRRNFKDITEQALMGICILQDGEIKYVNQFFAGFIGYTVEEMLNWKPNEFIKTVHPEDRKMVIEQTDKKQQGKTDIVIHYTFRGIKKSGEIIWVDNYSKPIKYNGRFADLITIVDITEQKKAEHKLKESEEKFRSFMESATDFMFIADEEGNFTYVNKSMADTLEYTKAEMKGMHTTQILSEKPTEDFTNEFRTLIENGFLRVNDIWKSKTGRKINVEVNLVSIYDDGKYLGCRGVIRDISERKQAEQKLRESEVKYRKLFENNAIGVTYNKIINDEYGVPINFKFIDINARFTELTGLTRDMVIGKNGIETLPGIENDPADWIDRYGKVALEGTPVTFEDYSESLKKWYSISAYSPLKGYFVATLSDITEQKEMEISLKESEEKYRTVIEESNDGIIIIQDEIIQYINPAMSKMLGYSHEEYVGKPYTNIVHPDEMSKVTERYKKRMA
ncbi:MAG: PAS domain S-box protein, partial [Promethearchaeota archaeon]